VSVQFVPQSRRSVGQIPYFGVVTVVRIAVGNSVVVIGDVVEIGGNDVSVSTMTYDDGVLLAVMGFPVEFPTPLKKIAPAATAMMNPVTRITIRILFKKAGAQGDCSFAVPAISVPSGEPHWPQNLSTGFAGAPQEGQERNRDHQFSHYTPFPAGRKKVSLQSSGKAAMIAPLQKNYFRIYHPVMVSSSTFSEVFFVTMLTTIIAMSEMTKA